MDGLDYLDHGGFLRDTFLVPKRWVLPTHTATAQSRQDPLWDEELGNTCPGRRKPSQHKWDCSQIPSPSFHHDSARAHSRSDHTLHDLYLWSPLPLLWSVPNRVSTGPRMEPGCWRTPLPWHHHWGHPWCRRHHVHIPHTFQAEDGSQRRKANTRGEADSNDYRSFLTTSRPLLVCMDIEPTYHLGTASHRRYTNRNGSVPDLLARVELYYRRLPDAREQRHRRKYSLAISGWRRIPAVR